MSVTFFIIGIIACMIVGIINLYQYFKYKGKGNLYVSIFDFAAAIFMIVLLIIRF